MKLSDFLTRVKDLPPDTLVSVAEVDEAFAANVAEVEIIETAKTKSRSADGTEAVDLSNGNEKIVVIRW